ncbi:hypothetical protein [Paraburkholderia sp.]|uniref:hypothetical protein n=1 Tax=Paraburkholderia sp. TaxID=1926495 RepID=UPI0039E48438
MNYYYSFVEFISGETVGRVVKTAPLAHVATDTIMTILQDELPFGDANSGKLTRFRVISIEPLVSPVRNDPDDQIITVTVLREG